MTVFAMPIVLMIDADSLEEAQKSIDEWVDGVDIGEDLPSGTEDLDSSPNCEHNDEGQRMLYLPIVDDTDDDLSDEDKEDDDFNEADADF